jgi:titin
MGKLLRNTWGNSAPSRIARERIGQVVEALEARRLFAVLTVNSTADSDARDSVLTLREAINLVNGTDAVAGLTPAETSQINFAQALGTNDTIQFKIPGTGSQIIQLTSELPGITKPVTINGYSQPGSAAATSNAPATVLIDLDGATGSIYAGLSIQSRNVTVRGLSLTDFNGAIYLSSISGNDTIAGNWIGIAGSSAYALLEAPNGIGIYDDSSSGNTIGGTTPADRNVIAGNAGDGINLADLASNNVIEGNYIGVDPTGTYGITNATGIEIGTGSDNNVIGGTTSGSRNVISNNNGDGIYIHGAPTNGTTIEGNYIGTDATGTAALGNGANGVAISGNGSNETATIGGTSASQRNIISGNHGSGVSIDTTGQGVTVSNNYIGLSADGKSPIGNDQDGVFVNNARPFIGSAVAGAADVISGNGSTNTNPLLSSGIAVEGVHDGFLIAGNCIGTNAAGTAAIGNKSDGIYAINGTNLVIGEFGNASRNIISGNGRNGVTLDTYQNASVINDWIGLLADGKSAAGNKNDGVWIVNASSFNEIGGINLADTIANNGHDGVEITGVPEGVPTHNLITRNSIYNNGALGIDLDSLAGSESNAGVTLNDPGDGDLGPNDYQNFPVIAAATDDSKSVKISGTLNSTANTAFTIDLFGSDKPDPSGYGEGKQYLGSVNVTTDGNGNASFSTTFAVVIGSNVYISGTASTSSGFGETSEFGKTIEAVGALPAAPGNLKAATNSGTQVTLTWADNSNNETGFQVQRSTSSSFTNPTNFNVAANATTYVDATTSQSTTYYYRVRAMNAAGGSAYSTAVQVTTPTPLATPGSLAGTPIPGPAMKLKWKDNASGETGYEIQVSTSSSFTTVVEDVNIATPNLSTYEVTGLKASTYYYFRVRAVSSNKPALNSAWSSSVKLKTLSA